MDRAAEANAGLAPGALVFEAQLAMAQRNFCMH